VTPDDPVTTVLAAFREEAGRGVSSRSDFERLKGRYIGREKGLVPALFARIRTLPPQERGGFGSRANAAKKEIEEAIAGLAEELARREVAARQASETVDVTLPGRRPRTGGLHPVTLVRRRIEQIFLRMGYSIADGPELENDRHNFEALNFPPEHPARDSQDSFFVARKASSPPGAARRCGSSRPGASIATRAWTRPTRRSSTRSRGSWSSAASRWRT